MLVFLQPAAGAAGQTQTCLQSGDYVPVDLGVPTATGQDQTARLDSPDQKLAYRFSVPQSSMASLYVGDQWYDLALYLYEQGSCPDGSWERLILAWSARVDRNVIQFIRPNEQLVNLDPGKYLMVVGHRYAEDPQYATDFNPNKSFTVRVALNSAYCGLDPDDAPVPNPFNAGVTMHRRPDDALYQLAVTIDPSPGDRGPFALLTFTAVISPPYADLYDFSWTLDGQTVQGADTPVLQWAVADLQKNALNQHTIGATATGARPYPDPATPQIPPNLSAQCSFQTN
jgi:hypothetical protein